MANSGNFISATGVNLNVYVTWTATQNQAANTSTITMNVYLRHYSLSCAAKNGTTALTGAANQAYSTPAYSFANVLVDTLMTTKTFTRTHNADGTCPATTMSASWTFNGTYGGKSLTTITATSATIYFDTILRESIPGTPNLAAFEAAFTWPTTRYVPSYYDAAHIYVNATFICARYGITNGISIDFTDAELQAIYNAAPGTTVTVTFYLGTFTNTNYNVQLGSWHSVTKTGTFSWGTSVGTITWDYIEQGFSCTAPKNVSWYYSVLWVKIDSTYLYIEDDYIGGTTRYLTDDQILLAYNAAKAQGSEMNPTVTFGIDTYLGPGRVNGIAYLNATKAVPTPGTISMKIPGIGWKNCIPYIKVAGVWQKCLAYRNVSGTWKRGI